MVELLRRYANHGHLRTQLAKAQVIGHIRPRDNPISPPPVRMRLPRSVNTEVIEAYKAGQTTRQLAQAYGCSKSVIETILLRSGTRMRKQPLAPELVREALDLHAQGLSTYKIAARFCVVQSTVWRAIKIHK